jgi:transcriptional regulator with XRE-family HTH domain
LEKLQVAAVDGTLGTLTIKETPDGSRDRVFVRYGVRLANFSQIISHTSTVYISDMDRTIGGRIREERTRMGWEQADLAQRLAMPVEQQTVSRWERGGSRPRRAVVVELANLFGVDPAEFLAAAGYSDLADQPQGVQRPVRPRLTILPAWELYPDKFEELVADLAQELHPDTFVSRFGGQGSKQHGVDVVGEKDSRYVATFQCKRRERFGPQDVRDAVAEVTIDAPAHFLVLSRRSATPDARQEMLAHAGWTLWDAQDLSRAIRRLSRDRAVRIVDTYFPGWREAFLGVAEPGPWLTTDEYFLAGSPSSLYNHLWTLVGRGDELTAIRTFIDDPSQRIGLLVGRGGLGKTKLLREIAHTNQRGGLSIRFLKPGAELYPEHYELLRSDAPVLIIVDDAHGRDDVEALVGDALRRSEQIKILLALRPYALTLLAADFRQLGLRLDELSQVRLDDLPLSDAEALAAEALGTDASNPIAQRLGRITADCPFVTVIAGVLIQRGMLNPVCVDHEETIRREVLLTFRDVMVGDYGLADSGQRHAILNGIAAFQPFRSADPTFQNTLSNLISQPYDRAVRHIRSFEDAGILLRRGDSLRVVPDLLGDIILSEACFDDRAQVATGFLERAWSACEGESLRHLFANATRISWQIRHDYPNAPRLTDALWNAADEAAQVAGILGRINLLKLLQKVAYFEPQRSLQLVRWLMNNPTDSVEDVDHPMTRLYKYTYQDVLNEIPAVLQAIAHNMEYLRESADLLWRLAATDRRETNRFPEHPLRILRSLAEITPGKPLAFNEAMIDAATDWLRSEDEPQLAPSPFDVVEPILATEGSVHSGDGFSIRFHSFTLAPTDVEPLRDRVLAVALSELSSVDIRRAVRAISVIEASLRGPMGLFGHSVSEEVRLAWVPSFLNVLERLRKVVEEHPVDSVVGLAIRRALQWHLQYGDIGTTEAARSVVESLPRSLESRVAVAIFDGWGELLEGRTTDLNEIDQLKRAQTDELLRELESLSDREMVELLERRLSAQEAAFSGKAGAPGVFIWHLVEARPSIGELICERVSLDPQSVLSSVVAVVLGCLANAKPDNVISFARAFVATDDLTLSRAVAHAFGWNRGTRTTLLEGEMDILVALAEEADPVTRQLVVTSARQLAGHHRTEALTLICRIPFEDSPQVTDDVLQLFVGAGALSWDELPEADAKALLAQLEACPSIEEYWIQTFLVALSVQQPTVVVDLLKRRIDRWEEVDSVLSYNPLPFHWHTPLQVSSHPQCASVLAGLSEWLIGKPASWKRQDAGGRLFAAVAHNFEHPDVMAFLERTLAGARSPEAVRALSSILRQMPREILLTNSALVARVFEAASKLGEDAVVEVGGAMHGAVTSGSYLGTPGQPFPRDIEQRDQARAVARTLVPGSPEELFYRSLEEAAEERMRWQAEREETMLDSRAW